MLRLCLFARLLNRISDIHVCIYFVYTNALNFFQLNIFLINYEKWTKLSCQMASCQ